MYADAFAYDDPYVSALTSLLCFAFCFVLMLMLMLTFESGFIVLNSIEDCENLSK